MPIPTTENPGMPSADDFWTLCAGYRDAGNACLSLIRNGKSDGQPYIGFVAIPCIFSYFRSIELGLKAVLKENGSTDNEITCKYGHRLTSLLKALDSKDVDLEAFGISPEDRVFLDKYSEEYSRKWYEYPDDLWKVSFDLEELQILADRVCDSIKIHRVALKRADSYVTVSNEIVKSETS